MGAAPAAVVVLITTPPEEAQRIADALVEGGFAACVNILPAVRSVYRWEGAVRNDDEALLVAKTTAEALDALTAHVRDVHPYENPEVVALPVVGGSEAYLAWIAESVPRAK